MHGARAASSKRGEGSRAGAASLKARPPILIIARPGPPGRVLASCVRPLYRGPASCCPTGLDIAGVGIAGFGITGFGITRVGLVLGLLGDEGLQKAGRRAGIEGAGRRSERPRPTRSIQRGSGARWARFTTSCGPTSARTRSARCAWSSTRPARCAPSAVRPSYAYGGAKEMAGAGWSPSCAASKEGRGATLRAAEAIAPQPSKTKENTVAARGASEGAQRQPAAVLEIAGLGAVPFVRGTGPVVVAIYEAGPPRARRPARACPSTAGGRRGVRATARAVTVPVGPIPTATTVVGAKTPKVAPDRRRGRGFHLADSHTTMLPRRPRRRDEATIPTMVDGSTLSTPHGHSGGLTRGWWWSMHGTAPAARSVVGPVDYAICLTGFAVLARAVITSSSRNCTRAHAGRRSMSEAPTPATTRELPLCTLEERWAHVRTAFRRLEGPLRRWAEGPSRLHSGP